MKVNEVPQDKGYLIQGRISDLNYVVDAEGHYTSIKSLGWKPKNEAMKLAWQQVYENASEIRKKILDGVLSPIALYMELNVMDVSILASYMGIPKRKVKRHLKMKAFQRLSQEMINRYAETLNITPEELVNIEIIRNADYENRF